MATAQENTSLRDLHNWIIAHREVYQLLTIKITEQVLPMNEERYHIIHTIQSNLTRLFEQKKKAIESYLYLHDQDAGGDLNIVLEHILELNKHIKTLLCL